VAYDTDAEGENPTPAKISQAPERIEARRYTGSELQEVFDLLSRIEERVTGLERRGIPFMDLLARRDADPESQSRLPRLLLEVIDRSSPVFGTHYFWSEADERAFREEHQLVETDPELDAVIDGQEVALDSEGNELVPGAASGAACLRKELHEARQIDPLLAELSDQFGLDPADYGIVQEVSLSGEVSPPKFELLVNDGKNAKQLPVPNLSSITDQVLEAGRIGIEIKRFKGLGEMDADQLWETTMNFENRTLMRVTWDAASEAAKLFSILMGEEVEPRRKYIEDHALEVKNLDV